MSAVTADGDTAAYLRGKLRLAGVDGDTELDEMCDVLTVVLVDGVPGEQLGRWRDQLDQAAWKIKPPDRSSWGLRPDQIAAQRRLMDNAGGS